MRFNRIILAISCGAGLALVGACADGGSHLTSPANRVPVAKATVGEALRLIGQEAVQLHGAMGLTEELRVGHYFKRATRIESRLGTVDMHIERYAAARLAR